MRTRFFTPPALAALLIVTTSLGAQNPDYVLTVEDRDVPAGATFTIEVNLDSLQGSPLGGWSYGVCHDAAALTVESVVSGQMVFDVTGSPPFFEVFELFPDGYSLGVIVNSPGNVYLPPSLGALSIGTYTHALANGDSTTVSVCDTLANPTVDIALVDNFAVIEVPVLVSGTITALDTFPWIRGDANDDGLVNLADGIFLLNELFQGGPAGTCLAAKDANSDDGVDTADAIYLFNALFLDGPPPAAPFPECGALPSAPTEDCEFQASCL